MSTPKVTFFIPCYKLAHLLAECLNSILSQTYRDFEVLIMDDCSPDNTPEVARSFQQRDPRVKHIRNDPNLGHIRNYNKAISISRGKYVWLISADDYLRKSYILERYVEVMEKNSNVGYVFCPAYGVRDGKETRLLGCYSQQGDRDRILSGSEFLKRLLFGNFVIAPSGMVRRECYEKISVFRVDMPWAGDWYLWCLFALHYDVAYFAEPMLCYREHHDLSMTSQLHKDKQDACVAEEIAIPWELKRKAEEAGVTRPARRDFLAGIARSYARVIPWDRYTNSIAYMNFEWFEESLAHNTSSEQERNWIRPRVYAAIGDHFFWSGERSAVRRFYDDSIKQNPWMLTVYAKRLLLSLGGLGDYLRRKILSFR